MGRCIKLRRFETSTRLEVELGRGGFGCDGGVSIDDVLCSLITGSEVGVVVGEEFQVGV